MNDSGSEYGIAPRRGRRAVDDGASAELGRTPPHSLEAERGVLGCVLLDPGMCLGVLAEKIRGRKDVFYDLRHQAIYEAARELEERQRAVDLITLQERLKERGELEQVGGLAYLSELADGVPSAANLNAYLGTVVGKYRLRRLVRICAEGMELALGAPEEAVERVLLSVEGQISALTEGESSAAEEHVRTVLERVVTELEENRYVRGKTQLRGLPTGPDGNYLDKLIRGIRETFYMVIAGRPGDGKTSLVMNMVEYLACDYVWWKPTGKTIQPPADENGVMPEPVEEMVQVRGIPVGVISIEMDGDSLVSRLLFGRAGVDVAEFMQGFAEKEASFVEKITKAAGELARANIYIDASPAQGIGQIAAKARRMVKQYGVKLFVLDYLQLVEDEQGNGDRVRELTRISRKIMALKKQLRVPWLVLAQMNRNIETSEAKRVPVLSDLKDCGAIEQDCDLAMFLYKPSRKALEESGDEAVLQGICGGWPWSLQPYRVNVIVAKNRFGPTGIAELVFQKNLCRFEDWHMFKVKHGAEGRKAGESRQMEELPTNEDLGLGPMPARP